MTLDRDGEWSQLRFEEAVLSAFTFLVAEYGFAQTSGNSSCVTFARDGVIVTVEQDRRSFEVTAFVERQGIAERFSVWEIARLAHAPSVTEHTFLQASTAQAVQGVVPRLAQLLREHGRAALRGDLGFFARLRELQINESGRFLQEGRLRWIREQLREAWDRRNYQRVVDLLSEVEPILSPSEREKLAYARRQLQDPREHDRT
jgi:hypothetical protein